MIKNLKIFGRNLTLNLPDEAAKWVYEEIFEDLGYQVIDGVLKSSAVILDVGAHVGLFSIYARLLNRNAKIFAYEPFEGNFLTMKENLKKNGCENVVCKNSAVGASDAVREIYVNEDSHNHSFHLVGVSGEKKKINVVSMVSILEKLAKEGILNVDLVKLDCEGSEFEILQSLSSEHFVRIRCFYIEFHEYEEGMERQILVKLLSGFGYKVKIWPSKYDARMGFILAKR